MRTPGEVVGAAGADRALVREPGPEIVDCALTFQPRRPLDLDRLHAQHRAYVGALEDAGMAVTVLPPLPGHPDAVFVEDAALLLDEVAVLCRSGAVGRRAEPGALRARLPQDRPVATLPDDVHLDGGDVLRIGHTLFVGRSTRSSPGAAAALGRLLEPWGYRVEGVTVGRALHLKTVVTAVTPHDWVVHTEGLAQPGFVAGLRDRGCRVFEVTDPEAAGANVLPLPDGTTLVAASAPELAERLARARHRPTLLDVSEFEKAEAGLTCLSLTYRSAPRG